MDWRALDDLLRSAGLRVGEPTAAQTYGGVHVPTSLHYVGRGRDYGSSSDRVGIAKYLESRAKGESRILDELFYSPLGIFYKNGTAFRPSDALRADHQDHVHAGLRTASAVRALPLAALLCAVGLILYGLVK